VDAKIATAVGRVLLLKVLPVVAGLVVLVLVIAALAGMFSEKTPPGRVETPGRTLGNRQTDQIHEITKPYVEEAVGTLRAARRTFISAKILAQIQEVTVSAGDEVTEGKVLVRLSGGELHTRLKQANQALLAGQANLGEAQSAYRRLEQLRRRSPGAVSQEEFDKAVARLDIAAAEEVRLKQAVEEAKVMLSYAEIPAPKSGRIVQRLAEPGDTARPGEPLLELYDPRSLRLEAPVMERLAVRLKVGDPLRVRIEAHDRELDGTIAEIVPQAAAGSRSFLVKVSLPNPGDLHEGMFGRLYIPAGQRKYLCLATAAVRTVGQLDFVDVVRDDDEQTLERRLVKLGRIGMPGRVEVLSGLKAGERVMIHDDSVEPSQQGRGGRR